MKKTLIAALASLMLPELSVLPMARQPSIPRPR